MAIRRLVQAPVARRAAAGLAGILLLAAPATWLVGPSAAQQQMPLTPASQPIDLPEEILLPEAIGEQDVSLSGRYVRQWRKDDGTLVLMFTGAFRLEHGRRRLSANDAVIWINTEQTAEGRKYFRLTVYLSENAEVQEPAGTLTQDSVLLVSNLRTFGRLIKHHDAHSPEPMEHSDLYRRAIADRAMIEQAAAAAAPPPEDVLTVQAPSAVNKPEKPPRAIYYRGGGIETVSTREGAPAFVLSGGVYVAQAGSAEAPALEILADRAVIFPAEGAAGGLLGDLERREGRAATQPSAAPATTQPGGEHAAQPESPAGALQQRLIGVYLEGDVRLSLGNRYVRSERLYYDFQRDRALILDAVFRADLPERKVPLYVRADEVRQLSAREYSASNARVTTSEFYSPHYHIGAERVIIRDRTTRDVSGGATGPIAGQFELTGATFNIAGIPLSYWPYSKGDFETSETLLRRLRTGYSGDLGFELETSWYLFNLLGIERPPGYDATLLLDYFSDKGPATGINVDYARQDYFGLWRTYYINDKGTDDLGPIRDGNVPNDNRGRVLWRHRHYLEGGWEATFELAYLSDPNFLEEYFRDEFNEGKEQETLIYLKRVREVDAITLLANWRLPNWTTQTEHLPDLTYRRIGDTFADPFVLYHESRAGAVRYRPDDRLVLDENDVNNLGPTDSTFRADARQEAELPLKLGAFNLVPFATGRGTYWDGQPLAEGGLGRALGVYGVRGGITFSRVFSDARSTLLDIDRIRHIIRPDFAFWGADTNVNSYEINPFDYGIETIDGFYGGLVGLHQTFQTRRGAGELRRTVDLLTIDLEAGFFGDVDPRNYDTYGWYGEITNGWADPLRPENSRPRNYLAGNVVYRISDTTSLLYDFNFDLNDGSYDMNDVSIAVERLPRTSYVFGVRHAGDINLNLIGGGFNYRMSEKHLVAFRGYLDLETGELGEVAVGLVRRLPRWYAGLNLEYSKVDDDLSVSISLWPEGVPQWALGSRRFVGLGESVGIRPPSVSGAGGD